MSSPPFMLPPDVPTGPEAREVAEALYLTTVHASTRRSHLFLVLEMNSENYPHHRSCFPPHSHRSPQEANNIRLLQVGFQAPPSSG